MPLTFKVFTACLVFCALAQLTAPAKRVLNDHFVTRPFDHHIFQEVLSRYVSADGEVALDKLRAKPKRLNQYLDQLAAVSPETHPDYFPARDDALAYWINAHNAIALRLILDAYPVTDLSMLSGFDDTARYRLGGRTYSLQDIRRRIATGFPHRSMAFFALSDLTYTDPPLLNQAYEGHLLAGQLAAQTRMYFQQPGSLSITDDGNCPVLVLGPTLGRYAVPIMQSMNARRLKGKSSLVDFVKPYLTPTVHGRLSGGCPDPAVRFAPSDRHLRIFNP